MQGLFVWPNRLVIANGGDNPLVKRHLPRLQAKLKGLLAVTVHRAYLPSHGAQCAPLQFIIFQVELFYPTPRKIVIFVLLKPPVLKKTQLRKRQENCETKGNDWLNKWPPSRHTLQSTQDVFIL